MHTLFPYTTLFRSDAGAIQQSDVGLVLTEDVNNFSPSCDAIVKSDSFSAFPAFLKFSKISIRLIWTAFLISFLYNVFGLSFSISGTLELVVVAFFVLF